MPAVDGFQQELFQEFHLCGPYRCVRIRSERAGDQVGVAADLAQAEQGGENLKLGKLMRTGFENLAFPPSLREKRIVDFPLGIIHFAIQGLLDLRRDLLVDIRLLAAQNERRDLR